jgi:SNF2 family DNA or RNA helicase
VSPALPPARAAAGYKRLQAVLRAVLLRRTKSTLIDGRPIVALPPRTQEAVHAAFSAEERAFYDAVEAEAVKEVAAMAREGGGRYMNMLHLLLKLRQACNHPWLVHGAGARFGRAPGAPAPAERAAAARLPPDARAAMLSALASPDAQCPVCGDVPEDPAVTRCCHVFCRQCAAAELAAAGGGADAEFLCRACGGAVRAGEAFAAAALEAVSSGGSGSGGGGAAAAAGGGASSGGGGGAGGDGSGGGGVDGWQSSTKIEQLLALLDRIRGASSSGVGPGGGAAGAPAAPPPPPRNPLAAPSKMDRALSSRFRRAASPAAGGPPGGPPGRLSRSTSPPAASFAAGAGAGAGGAAPGRRRPDKVLVFSQWTSMLDLLEGPLRTRRIEFRRLDGTMSVGQRERAVTDFEASPGVLVLLVSLKAAALGLNLVSANHVVLMDLWWNPTVEVRPGRGGLC